MKIFIFYIISKNYKFINKFILFLKKKYWINFKKILSWKIKIKKLSILKSPHVNKKSQEQFEAWFIKKKITFQLFNDFKDLIFLKKLISKTFSDIWIKFKLISNKSLIKKFGYYIFNFKNLKNSFLTFLIFNFNKKFKNLYFLIKKLNFFWWIILKINFFLKNLDIFGESFSNKV